MRVLVNGRECDRVDAADRGLLYGDGLFETLAVRDGRPRFLERHLERLATGARALAMPLPEASLLRREIASACPAGEGVVRLTLTRGVGARGYRPAAFAEPTRIVASSPTPDWPAESWSKGVRVRWCAMRLGRNPALAGLKHLNRLEQVLARAEWDDADTMEGLLRDDEGRVIGATQANLFARIGGRWITPALDQCGVAGIMRRTFLEWAAEQGDPVVVRGLDADELAAATALTLTNALIGAWPVRELEGRALAPDPAVARFNAWLARA